MSNLTPREIEILRLVAKGLASKDIGSMLGISSRTVERCIELARLKINANNRVDLIVNLIRTGVIDTLPSS